MQTFCRALDFRRADLTFAVKHLAVEVARADNVVVDNAKASDAGTGQIQTDGGTKTADANEQHAGFAQLLLTFWANLRQTDLPGVSILIHSCLNTK